MKHKIVVYGGHETWLKAIQPLLKNAKFVLKDTKPTVDQIRHADMVWIQSNAFCHSFYGKVKSLARAYHIPINYFTYASATKCAEQLVTADAFL